MNMTLKEFLIKFRPLLGLIILSIIISLISPRFLSMGTSSIFCVRHPSMP